MTIPGVAISVPPAIAIAVDACDESFGSRLALAVADLGSTVLLRGLNIAALDKLQRTITARWCRAAIHSAESCGDAAIGISATLDAALARLTQPSNSRSPIEVLLVRTDDPEGQSELNSIITNLEPEQRVHAVIIPATNDAAGIDFAALAQICSLLISDGGKALPNQVITLHNCTSERPDNRANYPEMPICAPTVAPAH